VYDAHLTRIAELLRKRNTIDEEIAAITRRALVSEHLGPVAAPVAPPARIS
jgi:hypothetical protein